jgi:ThiF family protein
VPEWIRHLPIASPNPFPFPMSVPPEEFARIADRVNLKMLHERLVVVVGIGTVGSQVAKELARNGVGRLRLIDGDRLERANLIRHVLDERYVGRNKAEALAEHLSDSLPSIGVEALPLYVDGSISDEDLDHLLANADLVVAATDDRTAQRRIGTRTLALDVPSIFPALYRDGGGEVVVQLSPAFPCFFCWDGFRTGAERLRAVTALNLDTLDVVQLAGYLCMGLLEPGSSYAELLRPEPGNPPPQLFVRNDFSLAFRSLRRRPNCPACSVGPAPLRQQEEARRAAENPSAPLPLHPDGTPFRLPTAPATYGWGTLALVLLLLLAVVSLPSLRGSSSRASPMARIPARFKPCEKQSGEQGGIEATFVCAHPHVTIMVRFYKAAIGAGVGVQDEFPSGVPIEKPCPEAVPAEHAFYLGERRIGTLLCKFTDQRNVLLAWSDIDTGAMTKVWFPPGVDLYRALRWWKVYAYDEEPTPAPS